MRKWIRTLVAAVLILSVVNYPLSVAGSSYNYERGSEVYPTLPSVLPETVITGGDLGAGALRNPRDFRFGLDGLAYIADTGNHRILVLDEELQLLRAIDGFDNGGEWETFSSPEGIFAEADGTLYIADTQNGRIVVLDGQGNLKTLMDNIQLTGSSLTFRPQKVGVDDAGRVYAVSGGSTDGLIQLDDQGNFIRFFGSNRVKPNPIEVIYRMFLTRTQRQSREQFIPTEVSNLHVDADGFVYATTRNVENGQVRRLNAKGEDVLKHDGWGMDVYGDLAVTSRNYNRVAQFMAVTADADGNIYALDNASGKVFVYDNYGWLLFIFGGKGDQAGLFADPHAVAERNGTVYVMDAGRGVLTVFRPTAYGEKILLANRLYMLGEFEQSLEHWTEIARLDANHRFAWYAIGQAHYGRKDYKTAMEYFRLGDGRGGYSDAFGGLRDAWLRENFVWLMLGAFLLIIGLTVFSKFRRRRAKSPSP
ncbi:MAG: hypothetical protein LBR76_04730 [Oscillospiraceae bacterium]|jgi:DNA-binding beta-propeller fold protein YncE|nr:hypothetical protein [Oscillospiraceae bacterium]